MTYRVAFTGNALKALKRMDKQTAALILGWVRKNLEGCENPRLHGRGLIANRIGQWRYRIGDYRLIAEIQEEQVVILVLDVGHRSRIYE